MQTTDNTQDPSSKHGWQILGELELELAVGTNQAQTISNWLAAVISPLHLHERFATRVLKSAQEAVSGVMQIVGLFKHVHLLILVQPDRRPKTQNWGFFRIEKIGDELDRDTPDHTIEFYLYQDG